VEVGLIINEKETKYLKCTKKDIRIENLNVNGLHIEQVQLYKYLGSIINDSNSIEEEIKERIPLGIKAYCANLKFFKSRLVTKYSKLKLCRTVIRPIVTCASETWVLKETIIQKLLVFERNILRRIFGPTKENQIWRIKTNKELPYILKSNPHPFYSFRGLKNQMRIRIACGLVSRSRAKKKKNDRAAARAVRTIKDNNLLFCLLFITHMAR
jgi:hypothetical protein